MKYHVICKIVDEMFYQAFDPYKFVKNIKIFKT